MWIPSEFQESSLKHRQTWEIRNNQHLMMVFVRFASDVASYFVNIREEFDYFGPSDILEFHVHFFSKNDSLNSSPYVQLLFVAARAVE